MNAMVDEEPVLREEGDGEDEMVQIEDIELIDETESADDQVGELVPEEDVVDLDAIGTDGDWDGDEEPLLPEGTIAFEDKATYDDLDPEDFENADDELAG